jgi:putative DNA primase/helicase
MPTDTVASPATWLPAALSPQAEAGAPLLREIAGAVASHVLLPVGAPELIALFVVHAHAHDAAQFSPLLAIVSPEVGCGKTSLLRVLAALAPMPLFASSVTPASLYRTISQSKHTLLMDEADSMFLTKNELRAILNGGHCRDSAYVLRADGQFNIWCPKAIALVGTLPASLRDRSFLVALKRKRPEESVALLDGPAVAQLKKLGERAALWAKKNHDRLVASKPAMPQEVKNRIADNWRPLFAIADVVGGSWLDAARTLAVTAAIDARADLSPGVALLSDIRSISNATRTDRITTAALITALTAMEDRPWSEWTGRRPITASQVARILKPYGISPRTIRSSATTAKGYLLADFQDAFARYL